MMGYGLGGPSMMMGHGAPMMMGYGLGGPSMMMGPAGPRPIMPSMYGAGRGLPNAFTGPEATMASAGRQQASATTTAATAVPSSRFAGGGVSSIRAPMSDEPCKFFLSGGCRFGDACRNQHPGSTAQGQGLSMAMGRASPADQRICQFYLNGNCQYGDTCRNVHVSRPPPAGP